MIKQENRAEFLGQLIDVVEDWLEEQGIDIPNEEKDELNAAIIYGSDYDKLQSGFAAIMESYNIFDLHKKYPANLVRSLEDITEWQITENGDYMYECFVVFHNENGNDDETAFDVDCSNIKWRDDVCELWMEFAKENNFDVNGVFDVYMCPVDDEYYTANDIVKPCVLISE